MNLQPYFDFVTERHAIFERRFLKRREPPWTNDPILSYYTFTNVYRELDFTTLLYIKYIARQDADPYSLVLSTVIYRWFNKPTTYYMICDHTHHSQLVSIRYLLENKNAILDRLSQVESPLFSHAYTIVSHSSPKYLGLFKEIFLPIASEYRLYLEPIINAQSAQEAFIAISKLPRHQGTGFMAYEILSDLNYTKLWDFDAEQEFTNLGPGALRGLNRLSFLNPTWGESFSKPTWDTIESLWHETNDYLLEHSFPFFRNRLLSLRSIEHTLCEYDKYERVLDHVSNPDNRIGLRKFYPSDESIYMSLINSPQFFDLYKDLYNRNPAGFSVKESKVVS